MWADESAGGFDISGYGNSPIVNVVDNKSKKASSIVPVAIKQIIESNEDNILIAGLPVTMMTVVGKIKSIEVTSTKIVYVVQDWSGIITGMLWLDSESNDDLKQSNVIENSYCRMSGTKKMYDGKACMFVYNIVPIEDPYEIEYHYLIVGYIPFKSDELKQLNQDKMNNYNTMIGSQPTISNVVTNDYMGLTPQQNKVYRVLKESSFSSEAGMEKRQIYELLQKQMSFGEVEKIIEFLITEGHVYNTIDENHFKVTDG